MSARRWGAPKTATPPYRNSVSHQGLERQGPPIVGTDDAFEVRCTDPRFAGLRLRRNYGKSAALAVGFERVRGRYVATLDADEPGVRVVSPVVRFRRSPSDEAYVLKCGDVANERGARQPAQDTRSDLSF